MRDAPGVLFRDRRDAGRQLAREGLARLHGKDVVVLGLPRGGVPVAAEVASALGAPLDVLVVRKLGLPFEPEIAMGAIGENDVRVIDDAVVTRAQVTREELAEVERRERAVLTARVARLRGRVARRSTCAGGSPSSSMTASPRVRPHGLRVRSPAGSEPPGSCWPCRSPRRRWSEHFPEADGLACARAPHTFQAVSRYYRDFTPTSEDEVVRLLDAARRQETRVADQLG